MVRIINDFFITDARLSYFQKIPKQTDSETILQTIVNRILQHDRDVFRAILRQITRLRSERHMESYGNTSMQVEKEIQMLTDCENIKPFHISRAELEKNQTRQISILNCFVSTHFQTDDRKTFWKHSKTRYQIIQIES